MVLRAFSGAVEALGAAVFGTSERFWPGLQADFDLEEAHRALGDAASRIERLAA